MDRSVPQFAPMHLCSSGLTSHHIVLIDHIKHLVIALGLYIIFHVCPFRELNFSNSPCPKST